MTGRHLCCRLAHLSSSAMEQQFEKSSNLMVLLLANYGMNVLGAIVTLMVGLGIAGWWSRLADRAICKADKIAAVFHPLPGKTVRIAVIALMLTDVLNRLGVGTTSLIALLGAAGLAIRLALQGTLGNVASGVMLRLQTMRFADIYTL